MIPLREHFQTLGLTEKASLEDALASYKDLVRVWHPDRFSHDPRLRKKAEEQTSRINVAMTEVRAFFKNPSPRRLEPAPQPPRTTTPLRRSPVRPSLSTMLVVHQRRSISLARVLTGLLLLYFGWYMSVEHQGAAGQIAIGIVLCGYGFSTAFLGATLICFKRPFISVTNSTIRILGIPSIPLHEIAASHVVATSKGSIFTIEASPAYLKSAPLPLQLWLRTKLLIRRNHYEVKASALDTHPALILNTLELLTAQGAVHQPTTSPNSTAWAYYASIASIMALAVPIARILIAGPLPPSSILPYLMLFALLRISSVVKTIILAPVR